MHGNTHLGCDDACQSGLAESRRTIKKNVIKSFAAFLCSIDKDLEIGLYLRLTGILLKGNRP